jgi:hypothetical protein
MPSAECGVVDPGHELGEHALRVPQFVDVHVVAFERVHEALGKETSDLCDLGLSLPSSSADGSTSTAICAATWPYVEAQQFA